MMYREMAESLSMPVEHDFLPVLPALDAGDLTEIDGNSDRARLERQRLSNQLEALARSATHCSDRISLAVCPHRPAPAGHPDMSSLIYRIEHQTIYRYAGLVIHSRQLMHMAPRTTDWQERIAHSLSFSTTPSQLETDYDAFGNPVCRAEIDTPYDQPHRFGQHAGAHLSAQPANDCRFIIPLGGRARIVVLITAPR